jgi:hypothetical protein
MIKPRYSDDNVAIDRNSSFTDYTFLLAAENINVRVSDIQDMVHRVDAKFDIQYPVNNLFYGNIRINLYNRNDRKQLARDLAGKYTDINIDWDSMLEFVIDDIISTLKAPPDVVNIDDEPENQAVEYVLEPILIKNQPNSLFCPGGIGKTTIADYWCVLLTHGVASPAGFIPGSGETINCLYADYESDAETHRRYISAIEEGLGLLEHKAIPYISCSKPFCQYVEHIKELAERYHIELLVVDSIMAATAGYPNGMSEAQIASEFYNNLHDIGITSLSLDHSTKADMREGGNNTTPYGSIVKYNRCRSLFELKMDDSFSDSDHKEFALVHKKHNLTRKHPPIGISIDYVNRGDILESITFNKCDIADNQELSKKSLTRKQRLINALKELRKASIKDLADYIGEPENERIVGITLSKEKETFIKLSDGVYGLLANK